MSLIKTINIPLSSWAWFDANSNRWTPLNSDYGTPGLGSGVAYITGGYILIYPITIPAITGLPQGRKLTVTMAGDSSASNAYLQSTTTGSLRTAGRPSGTTEPQGEELLKATHTRYLNNGEIVLTYDLSGLEGNGNWTFYLWVTATNPGHYPYIWNGSAQAVFEYEAGIPVTSPKIIEQTTIIKPDDKITVKWSGAADSDTSKVISYHLEVRRNSSSGPIIYNGDIEGVNISEGKDITQFEVPSTGANRGETLYATIYAKSDLEGTDGEVESAQIARINKLPLAPSVTGLEGVTLNSDTILPLTIDTSNNEGQNESEQTLSIKYKINEDKEIWDLNDSTFRYIKAMREGSNQAHFYTSDGLEYSLEPATISFNVVLTPEIDSVNIDYVLADSMVSGKQLATSATIKYALSKGIINKVKIFLQTGVDEETFSNAQEIIINKDSSYENTITHTSATNSISIDIMKIATTYIGYGDFFRFAIQVFNNDLGSSISDWMVSARRPALPQELIISSITTDGNENALPGYFKNQITFEFENLSSDAKYLKEKEKKILCYYGENYSSLQEFSLSKNNSIQISPPGTSVKFKYKLIDERDQGTLSNREDIYQKADSPDWGETEIGLDTGEVFKPLTDEDGGFNITHLNMPAPNGSTAISYTYELRYDNKILTINKTAQQIGESTLQLNISKDLLTMDDKNKEYKNVVFVVTAEDNFGTKVSLSSSSFTIDFREAPTFGGATLGLRHDFNRNSASDIKSVPEVDSDKIQLFNPGEGIVFVIPEASDLNEDVVEYRIYKPGTRIYIDENTDLNEIDPMPATTPFITIKATELEKSGNNYYYRYPASQYTQNEYFCFWVEAVDSTGLKSSLIKSDTYIIGCRVAEPKFSVKSLNLSNNQLTYSFSIDDLGGSATGAGWSKMFYNQYPNLDKRHDGYEPNLILKVEVASDQNFTNEVGTASISYNDSLLNFTSSSATPDKIPSQSKFFVRFTLTINYTEGGSVSSAPQIYTYFGIAPTVAHRAHSIGINTNKLGDNDILVIENYEDKKQIVLKGTESDSDGGMPTTNEIVIDLVNGTISGLAINCGTW